MIFDGEKLTDLLQPLQLSWKERRVKELALMEDLVPQLKKIAQGRDQVLQYLKTGEAFENVYKKVMEAIALENVAMLSPESHSSLKDNDSENMSGLE